MLTLLGYSMTQPSYLCQRDLAFSSFDPRPSARRARLSIVSLYSLSSDLTLVALAEWEALANEDALSKFVHIRVQFVLIRVSLLYPLYSLLSTLYF